MRLHRKPIEKDNYTLMPISEDSKAIIEAGENVGRIAIYDLWDMIEKIEPSGDNLYTPFDGIDFTLTPTVEYDKTISPYLVVLVPDVRLESRLESYKNGDRAITVMDLGNSHTGLVYHNSLFIALSDSGQYEPTVDLSKKLSHEFNVVKESLIDSFKEMVSLHLESVQQYK